MDALVRDLEPFAEAFRIKAAERVEEARPLVAETLGRGDRLGLVLADHLLPGTKGVDFLIELQRDVRMAPTRKVLVTAQAGLQETVRAVNQANLHHYVAKPWTVRDLHDVVRVELTTYVIQQADDLLPYMRVLDAERLAAALRLPRPRRAD